MRWTTKLKLSFRNVKGKNSDLKILLLMISSGLMLLLNWSLQDLQNVGLNCEISCHDSKVEDNQHDFVSCATNGDVITKTGVRELGKPLTKKVFLTIGIPTIQRIYKNKTASYLTTTLNSLFNDQMSEDDLRDILIVVFLSDPKKTAREEIKQELLLNFGKYIDMNVIHVISAPSSFYPRLEGLKRTFGDSQERMYWRSKQTMDYVFMFLYSHGLAEYYMQLEDDVIAEPDYMSQIRSFIDFKYNSKWSFLQFTAWGFVGKVFHNDDLVELGRFMAKFYNEIPCDWLLSPYKDAKGESDYESRHSSPKEVFHHIGKQSSSLGTQTYVSKR